MQISGVVPSRLDFHVLPYNGQWKVNRENYSEPEFVALTQAEAIGYGIEQARIGQVSLIIHGRNGVIQKVWSY